MYVIEVPYLDLEQIYRSAQPLRWIRLRDGKFVIQDGCSALKVEQQKSRLIMSCTEEEFYEKWFGYFDMTTDYADVYFKLCRKGGFLKVCAVRNGGLRIIKQDLFECIIASIIGSVLSEIMAKVTLNNIAVSLGTEHIQGMREAGRIKWHEFPTPEILLANIEKLKLVPFLREKVRDICQDIVDGWLDLEELKTMKEHEVRNYLGDFGLSREEVDRILLYAFGEFSVIPFSPSVVEAVDREFVCDMDTFVDWELDNMVGEEGIVHQMILSNELNPPNEKLADEMKVGAHRWG